MHPGLLHRRFVTDLSSSLFSFVLPLLPTQEERAVKEEVRSLIEKLVKTIEPSARLLSFGSSQNSFGLRNSDMDLVVLIDDPSANLEASHLVQMIGDLLQRETNFDVKPLPKARIPILKLTLAPSSALPFGIACDIGIENRLAIENTRLLLTYATIDPARVRTLVLFLKVWAKRRRINSPYRGTLSSYGFTLMVLYYLVHVKQPPVLPNLQRIAPLRPLAEHEVMIQGRNVYFFDDTETLRQEWSSINFETVGELLIDFFRYFSHDFQFNNSVMSLRAGQLTKESKGWVNDIDVGGLNEMARDRNRLCIEDPFEISYNVARTVTKDGLYTLRGEFMRATRILTQRPDRAVIALAELCRERDDELHRAPRSASPAPRALSTPRGGFTPNVSNGGWRSHSQAPFDRLAGGGPGAHMDAPTGRRGRVSESGEPDYTAQELWLQSQGPNLGNVGGLGLGFEGYNFEQSSGGRGRDTATRGLETPGGYNRGVGGGPRRSASAYDNGGSGSISAPLSPHKLYAQLELGKPHPQAPVWPAAAFDQRFHHPTGTGGSSSSFRNSSTASTGTAATSRSNSMIPNPNGATTIVGPSNTMGSLAGLGVGVGIGVEQDAPSPLPPFAPFSPPTVPSILRPLNGEPANYISPSTLLSPNNPPKQLSASPLGAGIGAGIGIGIGATGAGAGAGTSLAAAGAGAGAGVDGLAKEFGKMGVTPPGAGNEEPSKAREEEVGRNGVGVSGNASEQEKVAEGEGGGVTSPDRQRRL